MNLKDICRICLIEIKIEKVTLSEQLYTFLEDDLRLNDVPRSHPHLDIPKQVCFSCYCFIVNFREFYRKCQDAEKFFKGMLECTQESVPDISESPSAQEDNTIKDEDDDKTFVDYSENLDETASLDHNNCDEINEEHDVWQPPVQNIQIEVDYSANVDETASLDHNNCDQQSEDERNEDEINELERNEAHDVCQPPVQNIQLEVDYSANVDETASLDHNNCDEKNEEETNKDEKNEDETNEDETNEDEMNEDEINEDERNKEHDVCQPAVQNIEIEVANDLEHFKENEENEEDYLFEVYEPPKKKIAVVPITKEKTSSVETPAKSSNPAKTGLFVCGVCGKECFTKVDLRLHESVHPGLRPFQCEVCDFAFKQRSQLNTHLSLHYGKKIKCPQCDKRYPRKSCLIRHLRTHSGERPFQCYQCGKTFFSAYLLRCHEDQIHSGKLQFSCQLCDQQFYSRFKLVEHKNKDHIRYFCKRCDKNYKMKESIQKHIKKEHKVAEFSEEDFIIKIG